MNDTLLDALAAELGTLLVSRGWRVTAAESCTGGLVAGAITATPGSSAWFEQSFVTYSNAAKTGRLDVDAALLREHGAVSQPVAEAMARGALSMAAADVSVAITGIAGPGGGTPGKPVGMVCFAWAIREGGVASATRHFDGDRAGIRRASVIVALEGVIECVRAGGGVHEAARMPG
jgi:nicotinamide-nucleotide amidase